jgi:peptidase E
MKHLILAGGQMDVKGGRAWVEALLQDCKSSAKVAFCLFAREESDWDQVVSGHIDLITRYTDKRVNFKVFEAINFAEVSAWANVVVIVGGDPWRLKNTLEQYGNLMELWDGKTISGSSAGADIMVRRYMYLQDKVVQAGFGWVPVNVIPHWRAEGWKGWKPADWQWAARELAAGPGETPLLCIREGDFVEIEVA